MASVLKQIADRVGVSQATVARILNGDVNYNRRFYRERADRIRAVAAELSYRPNAAARAISTGRFDTICLLSGDRHGSGMLSPAMSAGITVCAAKHEVMISSARLPEEAFTDNSKLPIILRRIAADGLLINYTHAVPEAMEEVLAEQRLPVVWLNCKREHNCVHPDDRGATRAVCERLVELGHRRITFFDPHQDFGLPRTKQQLHYSGGDRLAGYKACLKKHSLKPLVFYDNMGTNRGPAPRIAAASRMFTQAEAPTAVICNNSPDAVTVAALRAGKRVPEDCTLVSYTRFITDSAGLPIASLHVPDWKVGEQALDLVLDLVEHPDQVHPPRSIPIPLRYEEFLQPPQQ